MELTRIAVTMAFSDEKKKNSRRMPAVCSNVAPGANAAVGDLFCFSGVHVRLGDHFIRVFP